MHFSNSQAQGGRKMFAAGTDEATIAHLERPPCPRPSPCGPSALACKARTTHHATHTWVHDSRSTRDSHQPGTISAVAVACRTGTPCRPGSCPLPEQVERRLAPPSCTVLKLQVRFESVGGRIPLSLFTSLWGICTLSVAGHGDRGDGGQSRYLCLRNLDQERQPCACDMSPRWSC